MLKERILWRSIQRSIERKRNSKTSVNLVFKRLSPSNNIGWSDHYWYRGLSLIQSTSNIQLNTKGREHIQVRDTVSKILSEWKKKDGENEAVGSVQNEGTHPKPVMTNSCRHDNAVESNIFTQCGFWLHITPATRAAGNKLICLHSHAFKQRRRPNHIFIILSLSCDSSLRYERKGWVV